jgi:hypothetical protein
MSLSLTADFLAAAVGTFGGILRFAVPFGGLGGAFFTGPLRLFGIFEFMAEEKHNVGKG